MDVTTFVFPASLEDFDISVSLGGITWYHCAHVTEPFQLGETRDVFCEQPIEGDHVKIEMLGIGRRLQLCEVEPYGVNKIEGNIGVHCTADASLHVYLHGQDPTAQYQPFHANVEHH